MSKRQLKGRVAVVVGATGGVGREIAKRLHKEGMVVVLSARNTEKLLALQADIGVEGVHSVQGDASVMGDVVHLFRKAREYGEIELVLCSVGTWKKLDFRASPEEADSMYRLHNDVFLRSTQNVGHVAAQTFLNQESGGTFINFSSHAATKLLPGNLSYSSAKAGARFFVLNAQRELDGAGREDVRFTDIQPAGMLTEVMKQGTPEKDWDKLISMEEVADLVVEIAESETVNSEYKLDKGFVL